MEQVLWPVAMLAAEWLNEALKAARNKDQQRFARLIEHAGMITAGFRALDREAYRLFLPIIYGDVRTWPKDKRERWAQDIINLAYEDRITPAIRISATALVELRPQQPDRDVARLVQNLLSFTVGSGSRENDSILLHPISDYDYSLSATLRYIVEALHDPDHADLEGFKMR